MRPELALFYLASCIIALCAIWHAVHKIIRHEEWDGDRPLMIAVIQIALAIGIIIVATSAAGGA
jgi:hypothetical protein